MMKKIIFAFVFVMSFCLHAQTGYTRNNESINVNKTIKEIKSVCMVESCSAKDQQVQKKVVAALIQAKQSKGGCCSLAAIHSAESLNNLCRDGGVNNALQDTVCAVRDQLFVSLEKQGICYGPKEETVANWHWYTCQSNK